MTTSESKRSLILKQVVVETNDGFIFREKRKDIGLTYQRLDSKKKPRYSFEQKFGSITLELSRSFVLVERRYPTFVDMIAKFGGFSRVITFVIFTFVSLHHFITME